MKKSDVQVIYTNNSYTRQMFGFIIDGTYLCVILETKYGALSSSNIIMFRRFIGFHETSFEIAIFGFRGFVT